MFKLRLDWHQALALYRDYGRTKALRELILEGEPIPPDLRSQVADIIDGRFKRKRGRPPGRTVATTACALLVWLEYDRLLSMHCTTEDALQSTAYKLGMSRDQVSRIIFPRSRQGAKFT
jgi:hypothetical protein